MVKSNSYSALNLPSRRSSTQSAAASKSKQLIPLILRSDLISLLFKSKSINRSESRVAQLKLEHYLQNNFENYVRSLCDVLCDRSNGILIRQAAGAQLRNAITCDEPFKRVESHQRWLLLGSDRRLVIKTRILSLLIFEGVNLVGRCVAGIACAEFPHDEWPDLLRFLLNHINDSTNTSSSRQYCLETIGLICNEIQYGRGCKIINQNSRALLETVTAGITNENNDRIKLAAIKTFVDMFSWINYFFNDETQRKFIMQVIAEATKSENIQIKVAALKGLIELVPRYYEYSDYCADQLMLCAIASETMKSEVYELRVKGIEFCGKLCFLEECWRKDLNLNFTCSPRPREDSSFYSKTALNQFLPILLHLLFTLAAWGVKSEEEENCRLLVHCLACLVRDDSTMKSVFTFAQKFVKSVEWTDRIAALRALSSLIVDDRARLNHLLNSTMPALVKLMNDPNQYVRVATAVVIRKACDQVQDREMFKSHIEGLVNLLLAKLDDDSEVAIQVCRIFESIAIAAKELETNGEDEETISEPNPLSAFFKTITKKLLDLINTQEEKMRWAAYHSLNVIVAYRPMNCYSDLPKLASVVLKNIQNTKRQILSRALDGDCVDQLSMWCLNFKMLLSKLNFDDARPMCATIVYNLAQIFNFTHFDVELLDENIYWTMADFVKILGDSFVMYSGAFKPLILSGLRSNKRQCVRKVPYLVAGAAALTNEVSLAMGYKFLPHFEEIVPMMMNILQTDIGDRRVKRIVLYSIAEMAVLNRSHFKKYIPQLLKTLISYQQRMDDIHMEKNNYEMEYSVNEMHKYFLKAYVSIMQSSKNDRKLMETLIRQLKPCLANMIQVISHIALDTFPIYDHTCVEILLDLCTHFGKTVFHLLDTQAISCLLERGRNSENTNTSKLSNIITHKLDRLRCVM